ncbi:MAG: hypothetical protein ACLR23_29660 [Clostridia bacterium]
MIRTGKVYGKKFATDFPDVEETDFNSNENIVPFQNGILLLEYIGAILSNVKGWRFKKLLILVGAGNTGKTQLRELTMNLLGRENCISIDMKKINERFGACTVISKATCGKW